MSGEGNDPERTPPNPMLGLLYILGGMAMLLIAAAFGYADIIAWSLSLALVIVGATGIGAGAVIVWRAVRERQNRSK
jgi:hypothetical protein